MARSELALQPPPQDLSGFPVATIKAEAPLHRVTGWDVEAAAPRSPWWFSSTPNPDPGRFDLAHPRGTLYAGLDDLAGISERVGPDVAARREIDPAVVTKMGFTTIAFNQPLRLAAVSNPTAVGAFGMTKELTTGDYELAQAWAVAFDAAGFDGILYASRFDNRDGPHAVAIFGDAGAAAHEYDESDREPDDILDDYVELTSARLVYPPRARSLEHREP